MELKLPNSIGGKRDLILATRQIEKVLNDKLQDEVRAKYGAEVIGTKAGQRVLNDLLELNGIKEDDANSLKRLLQALEAVRQYAPRVRISFAQEPDQDQYESVVAWFRKEVDQGVLVQVGVQPTIGAGCIVQTNSRRYDMSLKTRVLNSTPKFLEVLRRVG